MYAENMCYKAVIHLVRNLTELQLFQFAYSVVFGQTLYIASLQIVRRESMWKEGISRLVIRIKGNC